MAAEPALKYRRKAKPRPEPLGHLEQLIIENFKSYAGRHEIGPFDKFTCIIGPNGSGKSNIMDAISFCLGIRARHLRGDRLRDLVYRREEEDAPSNTRSAKVTIVFRTAAGDCLHFGRYINARGEGTYRFGPPDQQRGLGYDDFIRHLAEQHIYVKARNFLVFQGDVMELARRQGNELTGVLETISGSDQLKDEYSKLSKDLEIMQEKARMHFQHRREIEGALALLEEQRAEVAKFQALRARRDNLVLQGILFRLMCAERDWDRGRREGEGMQNDLQRADADLIARRRDLDDKDVRRKRLDADAEKLSSQNGTLLSNLEQVKSDHRKVKQQILHWEGRLKQKEADVREEALRHGVQEEALRKVQEDRAKAEGEIQELRHKRFQSAVRMTAEQRNAYDEAVRLTDAQNRSTREGLREAEERQAQQGRELAANQRDLQEVEAGHARGLEKLEEMHVERTTVQAEIDHESYLLDDRKRQAAEAAEQVRKHHLFEETLLEEHRELRGKLDMARARRERLELVEQRKRVADELRSAFPGAVLGRMIEIILPTQKRFELPLQVALGSMAEAIVVRDAASGRKCVRYLKEKRIPAETFLPLDRMAPPNVGALHLLVQGSQARRLATHCVQQNEKFLERQELWQAEGASVVDRAVNFLLKGTIFVDDLEEGKRTSFHEARRSGLMPQVVTLHGEVIAPNGNMSVQCLKSLGRIEFGGAERLHEIKQQEDKLLQVEKDLADLREEVARRRRCEVELREQAREIEERHESRLGRLRLLDASKKAEQKLVRDRAGRAEDIRARIEAFTQSIVATEQAKEALEKELLKLGQRHFKTLNEELGVEDVRDIIRKEEREKLKLRQEIERKEDFVRLLAGEEKSRQHRMRSSRLELMRRDLEQLRHDIEDARTRQQELSKREEDFDGRCRTGRERQQELNRRREQLEGEVKTEKAELQRLKLHAEDLRRRTRRHNQAVRVLLNTRCGIFRECHERDISVPLLARNDAAMELLLSREQDLDELPFPDLEASCRGIRVDYTALPQARKDLAAITALADAKVVEDEYARDVAALDREAEGLSPNMRALEECAAEEARLKQIKKQEQDASLESQRLSREFETVRGERTARFMKCYKHVEASVHTFYKHLTAYDGFEGGSAYLDLDDAEEPYNGGITFTACPPGKRFFPMELLSGGEKSMASLALLFAMHSYQPPPFMILDEVDAPFDRKNTGSLVHYLKKLDFQCLVISLKDTFFSHSDSIIGIFKDKDVQSSGALSLPLRQIADSADSDMEVPLAQVIHDVGVD